MILCAANFACSVDRSSNVIESEVSLSKSFPIPSFDESEARVLPVLFYHAPKRELLEQQFQWIKDNGFTPVHLHEVLYYFLNPTSATFPSKRVFLK